MNRIHREIICQTRVIDAARGTVEYIASDASIDSYGEVINPAGWQFNRFQRNAPFVDSHSYDSIDCLLGKVIDFRVVNKQLVETVQWAIDVPTNTLAIKGFQMTQAGYLKAVSVGFIPLQIVRPSDSVSDWQAACEDLGLGDLEDSIQCIYQKQEQLELSACVIGANPAAVAKAYAANILEDSDLLRWPALRRSLQAVRPEPRRSYSFPSDPKLQTAITMSKKSFADEFTRLVGAPSPTVAQAADTVEVARRVGGEADIYRATALMRLAMARQRRVSVHERIDEILSDPLIRNFIEALPRYLGGITYPGNEMVRKSLIPSTPLGGSLLPIDVSKDIFDLVLLNGVFKHLGVVQMSSMQTKIAQTTANPQAIVIPPSLMGTTTIPADVSLTGTSLTPEAATFAILLPVSRELLQDEKANLSVYLLGRFSEGLAAAIDYCALQGNGAVDTTNGGQTGIWPDNTIATVSAAQGNNSLATLQRDDFLAAVAAVSPAALQRPCGWIISTSFIAPLMTLVDGAGKSYLLKTPAETGTDSWNLVGFPVVWAAQAPSVQTPGSAIAAFGCLSSYQVGIRDELEVIMGDSSTGFQSNTKSFRALARGLVGTRAATGLAKLALATA